MMRSSGRGREKTCPILHLSSPEAFANRLRAFRQGPREAGFIERAIKLTASPESAGLGNLVQLGELPRARKACQRCLTASFRLAS
jgi:hypothetical protein